MKTCITCGMPLEGDHANDVGLELSEGAVCKYDSENGQVKSGPEIFKGGVAFFAEAAADGDTALAERLTRSNMQNLAWWQAHPFAELNGPTATTAEVESAMAKL